MFFKPVTHQAGGLPDDGGYVYHENTIEHSPTARNTFHFILFVI
jgi:hypothetical protein